MKRYIKFLSIVAVVGLVAAGCGDSGSSDFAGATGSTASAEDLFGGDSGGDNADDSPFGSDDTLPSTVGNIPGVSGECEALLNVFLGLASAFTGGDYQAPDLNSLSGLPGDLRDDAVLMVETLQEYSDGLGELGIDLSDPTGFANLTEAQQQAFAELGSQLDSDAFNEAADNLSAYGESECAELSGFGN